MKGLDPYVAMLGAPKCHPKFRGAAATRRRRRAACIENADIERLAKVKGKTARRALAEKTGCDEKDERCMLEKTGGPIAQQLLEDLRPAKPADWDADPDKWLDNTNIEKVLRQYESIPELKFRFYGVHPIDFAAPSPYRKDAKVCLVPKMCSITIPGLRAEGVKYAGVVFNLDNHLQSGSHWVGLVIDTDKRKPGVYYYDSYGMKPPKQVWVFMQDLSIEEPRVTLGYNGRRFQYGNSECGMYSTLFIIAAIHGMPFKKFVKRPIPDGTMIQLRDWFFS